MSPPSAAHFALILLCFGSSVFPQSQAQLYINISSSAFMPAAHGLFVTNGLQFKNIHPLEQYGTH